MQSRKDPEKPLEVAGPPVWKGQVVLLMDDSTAGPAEVFAAALHDRAGSKTVGDTTVGMAIIQRNVPTEEGGSLFMTVGRYVSPSGQVLGGKGLTPDERVLVLPGETGDRDLHPRARAGDRPLDRRSGAPGRLAPLGVLSRRGRRTSPATVFFALLSLVLGARSI